MPEPTLVKWNEETILEQLKKIAKEQLNLTPEQIEAIGPNVSICSGVRLSCSFAIFFRCSRIVSSFHLTSVGSGMRPLSIMFYNCRLTRPVRAAG